MHPRGTVTLPDSAVETKVGPAFPQGCAGRWRPVLLGRGTVTLPGSAVGGGVRPAFPQRCAEQKCFARGAVTLPDSALETKVGPAFPGHYFLPLSVGPGRPDRPLETTNLPLSVSTA